MSLIADDNVPHIHSVQDSSISSILAHGDTAVLHWAISFVADSSSLTEVKNLQVCIYNVYSVIVIVQIQ